ncbi:MAG: amidohydrolase family protein [Alphaproteobacteria bacterium]|nr:amidohydrolase family protein [Alphaproteobacteria bacterium]
MSDRRPIDRVVSGGHVLPCARGTAAIPDGAVAIDAGRIVAVGRRAEIDARFAPRQTIDARGCAVLPGLVDAYAHAGHGMIRGLHHPQVGWPSHLYWTATTPGWWRADADLAALERLKAGVTTGQSIIGATPARADDPAFADATAQAYVDAGLRLVLGIGPPDPIFPHLPEPFSATHLEAGQLRARRFSADDARRVSIDVLRRWHGAAGGRISGMLAPPYLFGRHVVHQRTPNRLPDAGDAPVILAHARDMAEVAASLGVGIHTHMFAGSVEYALRHFGDGEVGRVLSCAHVTVAHANGMTPAETRVLGRHRCGIASVAFTHENLWYGVAPIPALREAGCPVAITTDGAAPYTSYDLWREPTRALWNQWGAAGTQAILPPEALLAMMTSEAAAALGVERELGSLEPGKQADLICVDLGKPHLGPIHDLAQTLVLYATAADVRDVIVAGDVLMRDRRPARIDEATILATAREEAAAAIARVDTSSYRRPEPWDGRTKWSQA